MAKNANNNSRPIKGKIHKTTVKSLEKPVNKWLYFLLISFALILTYIAFFPSLKNEFVSWDDDGYLFKNKYIFDYGWNATKAIFSNIIMGNYHPLTIYVYSMLHHFYKFNPYPYHLFNILVHLINVWLVFIFIYKLSNNNLIISFVTALLFGIHPLHVESVTWVSGTKDVLYTFFFLIGLLCYLKYDNISKRKIFYYCLSLLFFIFSCLSKGMAIVFPLILVIMDYLDGKKMNIRTHLNKIPFFIIALIFGIIALKAQEKGIYDTSAYNLFDKICLPAYGLLFYLVKMVYPANLCIIYNYPIKTSAVLPFEYLMSPVIVILIIGVIIYSLKYNRKIAFGSLFFFLSILPVLQIIPVGSSIASDRYFYLSSIGLFYLLGFGINYLFENKDKINKLVKYLSYAILIILTIVCINLTRNRTMVWKNTLTLWQDVIHIDPKMDKPYINIGIFYDMAGNTDSAIVNYKKAAYYNPKNTRALNNLGSIFQDKQRYDSALFYYDKLVKVDPSYYIAYYNIGNIFLIKNDLEKSIEYFNKAASIKHDFALPYVGLGHCWNKKGDLAKSNENYIKAAQLGDIDSQKYLKSKNIKW